MLTREYEHPAARVVLADMPGQPLATAIIVFPAGGSDDPQGREGLAATSADLLSADLLSADLETQTSSDTWAITLESLGARWSCTANWDAIRLTVTSLPGTLSAALPLLLTALRERAGSQIAVRQHTAQQAERVRSRWSQPAIELGAASRRVVAGNGRYGIPLAGSPASARRLSADDITGFWRDALGRERTLIVAADLTRLDHHDLAAALPAATRPPDPKPPHRSEGGQASKFGETGRRVIWLSRPASAHARVSVAQAIPGRASPDYLPVALACTVLGGMHGSRLDRALRHDRTLSYTAAASVAACRDFGLLTCPAVVSAGDAVPTAVELISHLGRLAENGVTDEELELAAARTAGTVLAGLQTSADLAAAIAGLVESGLPVDSYTRVATMAAQFSRTQIADALTRQLDPDRLCVVVQGPPRPRDELAALGPARFGTGLTADGEVNWDA